MERRREIQEKYHFQQPPALRMDSKIESISAKTLKMIRPNRYIETVKFSRTGWARKRVVSNPFLYGESSFSEDDKSDSTSPCSPRSRVADESVFESNEDACNSSQNEKQELYENVNIKRTRDQLQRSRSAYSSDASYAEESAFESSNELLTSPEGGTQNGSVNIENMQEKWVHFFEESRVEKNQARPCDCSKEEEGNKKVEDGGQDLYENIQIANREGKKFFIAEELSQQGRQASEYSGKGSEEIHNGELYQNQQESIGDVEGKWQNVFETSHEDEQAGFMSFQEERKSREMNHSQIIGSQSDTGEFPAPDYMLDDSVYTNLAQMQLVENVFQDESALTEQQEDVYQVMSRGHHETSYRTEELYVNYSLSSRQHSEQPGSETSVTTENNVDFTVSDEESSTKLLQNRMTFLRP